MSDEVPAQAQVVVIGSGCIGCSVAFHLAQAGIRDVVVVEREPAIASVTSGLAAGNAGQVRSSIDRVRFEMTSVATYRSFQSSGPALPSWRETGSIRIALTDERVEEFRKLARIAASGGLDVELTDGRPFSHAWPHMQLDEAKAVLWCPTDGYLQPVDLANAYQYHARLAGVRFCLGVEALDIELERRAVVSVLKDRGRIQCETAVNCAGWNAWRVARMVGLDLPIFPVRHQYMITTPVAGITPELPTFRVPDVNIYGRPDVNSLLIGGWESKATSVDPRSQSDMPLAVPDLDAQNGFVEAAASIFPPVIEAGVRAMFSGWPTATPDGRYVIGRTRQVHGFVMGAGCNIHGVGGSAGFGRLVTESIVNRNVSLFLASCSPDRFDQGSLVWEHARREAAAISENYYRLAKITAAPPAE